MQIGCTVPPAVLMYYTVVSSALVLLDGSLVDIYTVG